MNRGTSSRRSSQGHEDLPARILSSGLLPRGARILVGVSGGPDSIALLHALSSLASHQGSTLFAAHLNHELREGADAEGAMVAGWAREWGAEPVLGSAPVRRLARQWRCSIEAAGRRARYEFFGTAALGRACSHVAVAHTADDQVETVLLNLLRGSGISGLAGMRSSRPLFPDREEPVLVRPMLPVWREEVLSYCHVHGLTPIQDPSNFDRRLTRNRVRLELIPLLAAHYNPRIRQAIARLAAAAAAERDMQARLACELLARALVAQTPDELRLDADALRTWPAAVIADALRAAFAATAGAELDWQGTVRLMSLLDPAGPRGADLVGGWRAERRAGLLVMRRANTLAAVALTRQPLPVPGHVDLPEAGIRIEAAMSDVGSSFAARRDEAFLEPSAVRGELAVRAPWPGARFRPLGMGGNRKLSDFFIDRKVPRQKRPLVPLVVDAEKILWVVGMALDDRARLVPGSGRALRLRARPLDGENKRHGIMDDA